MFNPRLQTANGKLPIEGASINQLRFASAYIMLADT
jgi:hypothetical protein